MKVERVKNAGRNIGAGMLSVAVSLILPFITRTVMIYTLGKLFTGLAGLFQSVFQLMNIAELGLGGAIVFFMYDPIAKDDTDKICALLNLYRKAYRVIGIVVFVAGLLLLPFLQYLIKDQEIPNVNIYVIYLIQLCSSVAGYLLFPEKKLLLVAYQRNDITSKTLLMTDFLKNSLQILILCLFKNYYLFVAVGLVFDCLNHILNCCVSLRMYPDYKCRGSVDDALRHVLIGKVKALFTYKIGDIIYGFADNIVVSAFLGLNILAIYNNYYYIIMALFSVLAVYYASIRSGIGNTLVLETKEDNYKYFNILQFVQQWLIGWITICLLCLFQPFMVIWVGEEWVLAFPIVVAFCIYFYVWKVQDIVVIYKDAAGLWENDRWRPLITSVANLLLNILTVKFWGLYGVIYSTIVSIVLIDMPWLSRSLFYDYFKEGRFSYYWGIIKSFFLTIIIGGLTWWICSWINVGNIVGFVIKLLICLVVPNMLYYLIYFNRWEMKEIFLILKKYVKKSV